jgi:WD40 repeat protein
MNTNEKHVYGKGFYFPMYSWLLILILAGVPTVLAQESNTRTAQAENAIFPYTYDLDCMAISPDGKKAAAGCPAGYPYVKVWDLKTGRQMHHFKAAHHVISVGFSADSSRVFSVCMGGQDHVEIWDIGNGKKVSKFRIPYFYSHYGCRAAISPDGKKIVSGGQLSFASGKKMSMMEFQKKLRSGEPKEYPVFLWNTGNGKKIHVLKGHTDRAWCFRFSPDGKLIASGSADKTVRLWEVESGKQMQCFKSHEAVIEDVVFSENGKHISSGGRDGTVKTWDIQNGKEISSFRIKGVKAAIKNHPKYGYFNLAFSSDGKRVAAAADNSFRIWDILQQKEISSFSSGGYKIELYPETEGPVYRTSPDGKLIPMDRIITKALFAVSFDGKLFLEKTEKGMILWDVDRSKKLLENKP